MSEAPVGGDSGIASAHKKTDKDKKLITYGTLALVVLTYLTYRRMRASGAASSTGGSFAGTATNNTATDPNGLTSYDIQAIENQLAGFSQHLAGVEADVANQGASDQAAIAQQTGLLAGITQTLNNLANSLTQTNQNIANIGTDTGVTDTSGAVGLSQAAIQSLASNGEYITDTVKSTVGGWLYLTNKGGVYNSDGSPNFGSYLGYASTTPDPAGEIAGHGDFSNGHILAQAGGHYTEVNSKGETYAF